MEKTALIREILIIGRNVDPVSISKRVLALTGIFKMLDEAIIKESMFPGFSIYVAQVEADLIWNICYSRLAEDGIYLGAPYSYRSHLDGVQNIGCESLFEIASYN